MKEPVILYSIQSYLAYYINTRYYNNIHYVWCAPFFDSNKESGLTPKLAYTSNPIDIFKSYYRDITVRDRHYKRPEIERNTVALLKGATIMKDKGAISDETYEKIKKTISSCSQDEKISEYFRPLIYVIPYETNKHLINEVDVDKSAGTLSPEYIIENLPTDKFNIIDLGEEGLK